MTPILHYYLILVCIELFVTLLSENRATPSCLNMPNTGRGNWGRGPGWHLKSFLNHTTSPSNREANHGMPFFVL